MPVTPTLCHSYRLFFCVLCVWRVRVGAGLPNITGGPSGSLVGTTIKGDDVTSGAIITFAMNGIKIGDSGTTRYLRQIGFDASNSNTIYGNSLTVTPKSCTIVFLIKY